MRKLKLDELNRLSVDAYKDSEKNPIVFVLDNIRSLNNVGTAFRTGDAFGIEKIYLCGITGKPPHRDINKTALGAQDSVEWVHFENIEEAYDSLKNDGYEIIVIEQVDSSISLENFKVDASKKYAFVFGNEVDGVSDYFVEHSNFCVEIPQFGTKHSLNVSVTMGIVAWDYLLKIKKGV